MSLDFTGLRAERGGCPSDAVLEEFAFEALPEAEAQPIRAHLQTCTHCTQEVAGIQRGFAAFPQLDERKVLAAVHTRLEASTPWWRRLGMLLVPLAIGGVAAIVFMTRPPAEPGAGLAGPVNTVRAKGTLTLRVFAKTGADAPREVLSGQPVAPGSRLQFMVDVDAKGPVRVFGVEADGTQYTAWPLEPALDPGPLQPGEQRLPGGAALDDAEGVETLHLVWCPTKAPRCTVKGPTEPLVCPADCQQTAFTLKKAR